MNNATTIQKQKYVQTKGWYIQTRKGKLKNKWTMIAN